MPKERADVAGYHTAAPRQPAPCRDSSGPTPENPRGQARQPRTRLKPPEASSTPAFEPAPRQAHYGLTQTSARNSLGCLADEGPDQQRLRVLLGQAARAQVE